MMPAQPILLTNATLFDSVRGVMQAGTHILVQGERVVAVQTQAISPEGKRVMDVQGRVVLPGLIDAHVHVTASMLDLVAMTLQAPSMLVAHSSHILRGMLHRGFTSVRDAGGADHGLRDAVAQGVFEGPRLFIAGLPLSQTGGHGDMRPRGAHSRAYLCTCAGIGFVGVVADGVGEVRRAAREQIRLGANQIKIMAGGGVSSPSDPLEGTQYAEDELRAICEEADAANLYAMAHAYSPRAITRAVRAGVRSIEHGNLLDVAAAKVMKQHGAYLVATLSTYAAAVDFTRSPDGQASKPSLGWSPDMIAKLHQVSDAAQTSLQIARAEGVSVVFGTDLLGPGHDRQLGEFALRAPVVPAVEQLQAATITAARLMGQEAHLGRVAAGCYADLIVMDGDPLQDIHVMSTLPQRMRLLMQGGRVVRDGLTASGVRAVSQPTSA
jgi:imidazolonepropionase-like amidohydrolase